MKKLLTHLTSFALNFLLIVPPSAIVTNFLYQESQHVIILQNSQKIVQALYDKYLDTQLHCVALNVYFESRGETIEGQRAVAFVTFNRVEDEKFPSLPCDVVWDKKQFSWTHDGKSDVPENNDQWDVAQNVAKAVYHAHGNVPDPTDGAVMFHSGKKPWWAKHYTKTVTIEGHTFYKEKSK